MHCKSLWIKASAKCINVKKKKTETNSKMFLSNQHIRMISEDHVTQTGDWSNDAENSALITGINYT